MNKIKFLLSEDAVTEVVDFVTILGILVLSIGLIRVAGYPMLKTPKIINLNMLKNNSIKEKQ